MKNHPHQTSAGYKPWIAAVLSLAAASTATAFEFKTFGTNMPAVDLHGFASQGYILNSGDNNYLGGRSSEGTFDDRDYGINASMAYKKFRVGAQFFGQDLGQYGRDKIDLDWGNVDYQAFQWLGIRAGRVKTPRGLYNETLDLDSTRTFAFLPQSVYDARLRDFNSAFDGGMAYGNIGMGHAGSLDYKGYIGHMSISTSSGASDYFNNDIPYANTKIEMQKTYGGSLFWNTPLDGLKVGYSASLFDKFNALRLVPLGGDVYLPMWRGTKSFFRQLVSIEYTYDKWVFAAEGGHDTADYWVMAEGSTFQTLDAYYGYLSATRQLTDKLSLGAYVSWSHEILDNPPANTYGYNDVQTDFAVAARYDFTQYLLAKLEVHYLDGSGKMFNTPEGTPTANQPRGTRDNSWVMLVAKLTLTF